MTNTAKKPAKTSRDTLDLDLDARLDQATSTLYLDDEPVVGDMLDQVLAKAKKELDTKVPQETPTESDDALGLGDGFNLDDLENLELENDTDKAIPLQSESLKSLENQLASVLDETQNVTDDDLDNLLGNTGYDFDSLLGDADDEVTVDEAQLNEDSLLAAVDELLNFGAEFEPETADIESEIVEIEPEVAAVVEPEIVEIEPEDAAVVEPEIVEIEPEVATVVEPEIVEIEPEDAAVVEPEIVEIEPEVATVVEPEIVEIEPSVEAVIEPEEIVATEEPVVIEDEIVEPAEVELTVEPEAALDDLVDSVPFEDTLKVNVDDEQNEELFVEEFNDFENVADIAAPLVEISLPTDDKLDLAQQLDGLNDAMENKDVQPAGSDLLDDDATEKENATPVSDSNDDNMDWLKQLDELDAADSTKNTESSAEPEPVDDWLKQLDELDAAEAASAEPAIAESEPEDDWMKQLEDLDAAENNETAPAESVAESDADDDWMKQLEDLDANETTEKPVAANVSDEDDWMKQLEDLDDKTDEDAPVIDKNFNIAEAEPERYAPAIDEDALIIKAAEMAIGQIKEEQELVIGELKEKQDLVVSQLRADQDTLETRNKKQFADAENSRKKTATFSYAALGVGIIGLLGSGAMGYLAYGTKNDTQTIKQSLTELEETVNSIVNKAPEKEKEIEKIKTSVEQLNQKVEKLVADQQAAAVVAPVADAAKTVVNGKVVEPAKGISPVNLLNSKTPISSSTTGKIETGLESAKLPETEITQPVDIAPAHPAGDAKTDTKLSDMAKKSADDAKVKAEKAAKAKAEAEKAKVKEEAALLTEKLAKAAAIAKAAANSKTDGQRKLVEESRAPRYSGKMTRGMARGVEKERAENSKIATSKTKTDARKAAVEAKTKEILNTAVKPQKAVSAGKYSVNVVSYQQEWFAQSKAAEFRQKGIPVDVAPVDPNNYSTKYRLKVGGFKTKAEADAYAAKIKKSHGLSETWTAAN